MPWGDLRLNGKVMEIGFCRCHGQMDLAVAAPGGLDVVTDVEECIMQRLWIYLATKKGERLNKKLGCCLFKYFHKPLTSSVLKDLESEFLRDLKKVYPEFSSFSVSATSNARNEVEINAYIGSNVVNFTTNEEELNYLNKLLHDTLYNLGLGTLKVT